MRSNLLFIAFATLCFLGLYQVKYMVREVKKEVVALEKEVEAHYEAVHMLEAEWAYLSRPDRIQRLADKHLTHMRPLDGRQLMTQSAVVTLPTPKVVLSEQVLRQFAAEKAKIAERDVMLHQAAEVQP